MKQPNSDEIISRLIEKRDEEPAAAYSAFLYFATLTPKERYEASALDKVAAYSGLSVATLKAYRGQFDWIKRGNTIDAYFMKVNMDERFQLNHEYNVKYAEETRLIQQDALRVARKCLFGAESVLDKLVLANETIETDKVMAEQPDGSLKEIPVYTTINMKTDASVIAPLVRVAIETPLKAAGLPTEVVMPSQFSSNASSLENKTPEEIAKMKEEIRKEKEKFSGEITNLNTMQ